MTPEQVFQIHGAGLSDEVYTQDRRIAGEQLHWNVTRLKRDALAGRFGAPIFRPEFKAMTALERSSIDWDKVAHFVRTPAYLHIPAIAVDMDAGWARELHVVHREIVDGNHRVTAREVAGLSGYYVYVCPSEKEEEYRVHFCDGNGRPIHFDEDLNPIMRR